MTVTVVFMPTGCNIAKMAVLRPIPKDPLKERFRYDFTGAPLLSERARLTLRTYDLEDLANKSRLEAAGVLHKEIQYHTTPDLVYTFAELSYLEATRLEQSRPRLAAELYAASALYSYLYLFDPYFLEDRNHYDPQFRDICLIYNGSLEKILRLIGENRNVFFLSQDKDYLLKTEQNDWNIRVELKSNKWKSEPFRQYKFAHDYEIIGLESKYRQHGVGVPLLACWKNESEDKSSFSGYYPNNLAVPATVILRPNLRAIRDADPDAIHATLELHDPLESDHLIIAGHHVPLESDLTTPIAYSISDTMYMTSGPVGMFTPEKLLQTLPGRNRPAVGFHMLQPYEPNKVPIVLVHGLFSTPMTWMEMFNALRSDPEIRENYQFWFYFYPTGQPFWISASHLRHDLEELRRQVDPERNDINLDQMVLVGHSMGGLISMLQSVDSQDRFWNLITQTAFDEIEGDRDAKKALQDVMFFKPNPSVKQVITIATPFRGSRFANGTTQSLARLLVKLPKQIDAAVKDLSIDRKDVIATSQIQGRETSVDALAPDSPFLRELGESQRADWVEYHNIIGKVENSAFQTLGIKLPAGDGIVRLDSAKVDWADSEIIVPSSHSKVHTHPKAILEVKRILLENLSHPEVQQAVTPILLPDPMLGHPNEQIPELLGRTLENVRHY